MDACAQKYVDDYHDFSEIVTIDDDDDDDIGVDDDGIGDD